MKLPTIKIEHPGGFAIINESDFDPNRDKLFSDGLPKRGRPKKKPPEEPLKEAE